MAEQIITKTCRTCKETKPLSEFYKHSTSRDGYRSDCIKCNLQYKKHYAQTPNGRVNHLKAKRRYSKTDKCKVARKRYNNSEKGKLNARYHAKRYCKQHPNRAKATHVVNHSVERGELPRPKTLQCHYGNHPAREYHHWHGYAPEHWLDVVPICKKCHAKTYSKSA
ncbi:MAG: hypothetical protein MUO31_12995 [Thermodesulfovibrionales bacterium]|nr:hypothetical protein [Thermodesulfovibrionales bacterium]